MNLRDSQKSSVTKEAEAQIEQEKNLNQKENIEMKKFNSTWKTVITVVITLASVAALVFAFTSGMSYQKSINNDIKAQVKEFSTSLSMSKK